MMIAKTEFSREYKGKPTQIENAIKNKRLMEYRNGFLSKVKS